MILGSGKSTTGSVEAVPKVRDSEGGARERAAYAAAMLSLTSALIHLWAAPEHIDSSWWGYGAFFIVTALAQGIFAIVVLRWPKTLVCVAGIMGNLSIVAMYVVTRTSGIPLGPEAGMIEDPGLLDMTSLVAQVGIVIVLVTMLGDVARKRTVNALFLAGAAVWSLKATGIIY